MTRWHYQHSGLQVESELHLPQWAAFETPPDSSPDLRIVWSEPPVFGSNASEAEPKASSMAAEPKASSMAADSYCFFVPEAAEYRVSRAGKIEICAVSSPDMKKVRVFLHGAAWAAFCYLRGLTLLHASVVAIGGEAVAFCGPPGAGKSSLAAQMTTLGYPLISDDLVRLDFSGPGAPRVCPSSTRLKLWRDALSSLGLPYDALEQDHARMEKYHVHMEKYHLPLTSRLPQDRLPLTAVFVLSWGEPACTRLTGTIALRRLVGAATYRGDLLEVMNGLADHWSRCADLTRQAAIWDLVRPRDWSRMDSAVALVLAGAAERKMTSRF